MRALQWLSFGLGCARVIGAWVTRSAWRSLAVLYASGAGLALSVIAFYVMSRYRFPLVPIVLIFAGAAVAAIPRLRVEWRSWIPGALGAAGIAALSHLPMTQVSTTTHGISERSSSSSAGRRGGSPSAGSVMIARVTQDRAQRLGIASRTGVRDLRSWSSAIGPVEAGLSSGIEALAMAHLSIAAAPPAEGQSRDTNSALERAGAQARGEAHSTARGVGGIGRTVSVGPLPDGPPSAPDSFGVRANFGDLLLRLGRTAEAIVEYEMALRLAPDDVDTVVMLLDRLAQAYTEARRLPEATNALTRALGIARAAGRDDLAAPLARTLRGRR